MRLRLAALLFVSLSAALVAQAPKLREVDGGTLISTADPAVRLTFAKPFAYAGGLTIDIMKVACGRFLRKTGSARR